MIHLFLSQGHETYNKFIVSEREKQLFSMKGPRFKAERFHLYKFMLEAKLKWGYRTYFSDRAKQFLGLLFEGVELPMAADELCGFKEMTEQYK